MKTKSWWFYYLLETRLHMSDPCKVMSQLHPTSRALPVRRSTRGTLDHRVGGHGVALSLCKSGKAGWASITPGT